MLTKDLTVSISVTFLFLLMLEAGLRIAGVEYQGSFFEDDPVTGFAFRPNADGVWLGENRSHLSINSLGMRDTSRTQPNPGGYFRVAILGDSHASNVLVALEDNMAKVLERLLNRHRPAEVLNFGVDGFSIAQVYLLLKHKVIAFHPDIVIVIVTAQTVLTATQALYPYNTGSPFFRLRNGVLELDPNSAPRAIDPAKLARSSFFWQIHNHVRLLQVGNQAIRNVSEIAERHIPRQKKSGWALDDDPEMMAVKPPESAEMETAWRITEALFSGMESLAKDHRFELWLVSAGHPMQISLQEAERRRFNQITGAEGADYADRRYGSMAAANGIRFLNLVPPMLAYATRRQIRLRGFPSRPPDTGHWNKQGNAVVAGLLAEEIIGRSAASY